MKLDVYEHLTLINAAFDQLARSLVALQKHRPFHAGELARFRRQSRESRASLNSYLTGAIEAVETHTAGRRFRERLTQERNDERDPGS